MAKYKFITYENIYDESIVLYALEKDLMEKFIDGVKFVEVTPDFKTAQYVRADSLKPVGYVVKDY